VVRVNMPRQSRKTKRRTVAVVPPAKSGTTVVVQTTPSNNQAKPKRKRNKRQRRPKPTMDGYRTTDQIQRSLAGLSLDRTMSARPRHPFLACRLNPLKNSIGGRGMPDGKNVNFLAYDFVVADTISVAGTANEFYIQTTNTWPVGALLRSNAPAGTAALTINGSLWTDNINGSPNLYRTWAPIGIPALAQSVNATPGQTYIDPTTSSSFRFVAKAYRLTYIGTALNCGGVITVTPNSMALSRIGDTTNVTSASPSAGQTALFVSDGISASAGVYSANNTPLLDCDCDLTNGITAFTKDTTSTRVEYGAFIVQKHRSSDYKIVPTFDIPHGWIQPQPSNTSTTSTAPCNITTKNNWTGNSDCGVGVIAFDNDWATDMIRVSGFQAGSSYRLETAYCIEVNPKASSAFYPLTLKVSPHQPAIIAQADNMVNAMPSSRPSYAD